MTLSNIGRVLWRWAWLIIALTVVTGMVLGHRIQSVAPRWEAQVKLQLTAPEAEDVVIFEEYRSSSVRDEMAIARNNFTEVLKSREVFSRTIAALGLQGESADYDLEVESLREADFLYVIVEAASPELAEVIANTHVSEAIAYYGEVRAKPATAARNFLTQQLEVAEAELATAEQALSDFQAEHRISALDVEMGSNQRLIEQLQAERNRYLLEGPANAQARTAEALLQQLRLERELADAQGLPDVVPRLDEAIARYEQELATQRTEASKLDELDSMLGAQRDEMARLVALGPQFNLLQEYVRQARTGYQLLLEKYTEAVLKENTVRAVGFIQVIEAAEAPTTPAASFLQLLLPLAVVASAGFGVVLAFILDSLSPGLGGTVPTGTQQAGAGAKS